MYGSHAIDTAYGSLVLEETGGGDLVIQVAEHGEGVAQVTLSAEQVSGLRIWLDSQPPARPTVVRTAGGIDYVAWRNRIRRAAGQHPEA